VEKKPDLDKRSLLNQGLDCKQFKA
jgi:hypothetical protein